jgi:hypothetical protein
MGHLPEPRRFGGGSVTDELIALTARARQADDLARPGALHVLRTAIERCLEQDGEIRLQSALAQMPDVGSYRLLWEAMARSIDTPPLASGGVVARPFALPVVFVAAASKAARIPGQLTDIAAVQALFERSNALGPTRNFGLSNALCSLEALEGLSPLAVFRSVRSLAADAIGGALPPAELDVKAGQEQTYLRFLVGAGVSPVDAPGFAETAANIGTWGRECAKALVEQVAVPGVQLLALPRPPKDMLMAPHSGRCAQLEAAFNLFASNAVRRLRMAIGDPSIILSAHENAEIRVTLSSAFAPDMVEGFCWPLHPLDDLNAIESMVQDLFADMRLNDLRVAPKVLPADRPSGVALYPRCDEWDQLCAATTSH